MNENHQSLSTGSNLGAISAALYVSFQIVANVLSTKIALLPIINWAVDGGTIIYPLTFTLRDFVHKTLGKKISRQIVILAGLVNLLAFLLFWVIGKIPADPSWVHQAAYNSILLPVGRIVVASIVAQIISELVDTEVFSVVYHRFSDTLAVIFSNSVALVIDSIIFSFIAFAGSLPMSVVGQIILTNIIIKLIMSLLSSPAIKLVPRQVSKESI
ncbi:MAG: queuosine precursor transporter [Patescibacteria group bacterium]